MSQIVTLDIIPVSKPRMVKSDAWAQRPPVVRYWAYKDNLIGLWGDREVPQSLHLIFTMPMPNSWSAKKQALMLGKPHQTKPDIDNLIKAFFDALLSNDAFIWDVRASKIWGISGKIEVKELTDK